MNRFLHRHPVLGALALVGGFAGALVLVGIAYDYAPGLVGVASAGILLMMVLAGNRHLS